ncbi:hypothetical protein [Paenibacillus kandeliae]|uniref:hypothetical protein n=1 Tax=Paenibacillus kandeliae TaxID=3231269 RepID=UPI00345B2249
MYKRAAFRRAKMYAVQWLLGLFLAIIAYSFFQDATQYSTGWIMVCGVLLIGIWLAKDYGGTARARHYRPGKGFAYYRMADWQLAIREWIILLIWAAIVMLIIFSPLASLTSSGISIAIFLGILLYQRFMASAWERRKRLDQQLIEVLKQRKILNDEEEVVAIYSNLKVPSIITGTAATGISDLHVFSNQQAVFVAVTPNECIIGTQQPSCAFTYTSIPLSRIQQLAVLSSGLSYKKYKINDFGMMLIIGNEQGQQCNVVFPLSVPTAIQRFVHAWLHQIDMAKREMDRVAQQPVTRTHPAYVPFEQAQNVSTLERYAPFAR